MPLINLNTQGNVIRNPLPAPQVIAPPPRPVQVNVPFGRFRVVVEVLSPEELAQVQAVAVQLRQAQQQLQNLLPPVFLLNRPVQIIRNERDLRVSRQSGG